MGTLQNNQPDRISMIPKAPMSPAWPHAWNASPSPHTQLFFQGPRILSSRKPSLCQNPGFFHPFMPAFTPAYILRFGINYI